jgi:hypothetical protein
MQALLAPPDSLALTGRVFPDDYPPVNVRGIALRPVPQDVSAARRFARAYCDSRGISSAVADDILLCLSEVVGNVRHALFPQGRSHVFVQLAQLGPFVSAAVFDPDSSEACLTLIRAELAGQGPAGLAESGRGLSSIVRRLSCRLEVAVSPHGLKRVSFCIDCLPSGVSR